MIRRCCPKSGLSLPVQRSLLCTATLAALASLSACSSVSDALSPAKVDYRTSAVKIAPLDVPPDLTQLTNDPRYQPPAGAIVSATAMQTSGGNRTAAAATADVAPAKLGATRIERSGNLRWLVTAQTPEQLWPQLRTFWTASGFTLTIDRPEIGVMETDWAEVRAKLPQNILQRTIGRVLDGLTDTGERDLYRTRIERTAAGTEIYLSHRGAIEAYTDADKQSTRWQPRANDPQLEAEMLSRLMQQISTPDQLAGSVNLATTPTAAVPASDTPARARALSDRSGAALQVDDEFDRAWRRVGAALDRSGFTVEDRDRALGMYYVRYVDPKLAGKEEPGFFARLFSDAKKEDLRGARYQINVKADGRSSVVSVLDSQGAAQNNSAAVSIVQLLVNELR
ncbi:MAG: outer membrane protein assembly factor BamC [Leptothrix sp. (in: b-proteobacteria)]